MLLAQMPRYRWPFVRTAEVMALSPPYTNRGRPAGSEPRNASRRRVVGGDREELLVATTARVVQRNSVESSMCVGRLGESRAGDLAR
jgi:hypothetical protein